MCELLAFVNSLTLRILTNSIFFKLDAANLSLEESILVKPDIMFRLLLFALVILPLQSVAQTDLALIDLYPVDYLESGSLKNFHPICSNMGTNNVDYSDMTVFWQFDNGPIGSATPENTTPSFLIAGLKKPLEGTSMNLQVPSTAGVYTLKVWISIIGTDINALNDTITKTVKVLDELPQKNVVLQMFKHQTCGPCYPADTMIKHQVDPLPNYHTVNLYCSTSDVIYSPHGDTLDNYAHPMVVFDHFDFPSDPFSLANSFYTLNGEKYLENLYEREEFLEPVAVSFSSLTVDTNSRTIVAEVSAEFYDDLTDDLRFNVYVLEDSILEYQASAPDPANYYHTRVLRTMLGNTWGQPSSIPSSVTTGQVVNYTFNFSVPSGYNMKRLRLIGLVQKYNASNYNRRILNSSQVFTKDYLSASLNENDLNYQFDLYPNPANDALNIALENEKDMKEVRVMTPDGKVVLESEFSTTIDISGLATGSYYLVVSNESGSHTKLFVKE